MYCTRFSGYYAVETCGSYVRALRNHFGYPAGDPRIFAKRVIFTMRGDKRFSSAIIAFCCNRQKILFDYDLCCVVVFILNADHNNQVLSLTYFRYNADDITIRHPFWPLLSYKVFRSIPSIPTPSTRSQASFFFPHALDTWYQDDATGGNALDNFQLMRPYLIRH